MVYGLYPETTGVLLHTAYLPGDLFMGLSLQDSKWNHQLESVRLLSWSEECGSRSRISVPGLLYGYNVAERTSNASHCRKQPIFDSRQYSLHLYHGASIQHKKKHHTRGVSSSSNNNNHTSQQHLYTASLTSLRFPCQGLAATAPE